ncbi:hypothetical protein SEVIR_2G279600v4 [Setaria viridis]|uniref:Uncharacterized protein n=1 Tax=Setaria viridis TaxID=4556 RepID=A0A4V6DBL2_SETVI|nr:hypothetical protein SEVIR_2G279600v2 [Setaria viridis]
MYMTLHKTSRSMVVCINTQHLASWFVALLFFFRECNLIAFALLLTTCAAEPGQELAMFVQTKCSRVLLYFARSKGHEGSRAGVLVEGHVQAKKEHAIICLVLSIFFICKVKLDRWLCNGMTLIFSCIVFHLN